MDKTLQIGPISTGARNRLVRINVSFDDIVARALSELAALADLIVDRGGVSGDRSNTLRRLRNAVSFERFLGVVQANGRCIQIIRT